MGPKIELKKSKLPFKEKDKIYSVIDTLISDYNAKKGIIVLK